MMGLFDKLFSDDPKDAAFNAMAFGLLGGKGNFNQVASNAMMGGQEAMMAAKKAKQQSELSNMQLEQMRRKAEQEAKALQEQQQLMDQEAAWRQSLVSPTAMASQSALAGGGGPTPANAAKIQPVDQYSQLLHDMTKAGMIGPAGYSAGMGKVIDREDQQKAKAEDRKATAATEMQKLLEKARLDAERQREGKDADLQRAKEIQAIISANRPARAEPAPSVTSIVDPADSTKMISVDVRKWNPTTRAGLVGVAGKEPAAALRETKTNNAREDATNLITELRSHYQTLDNNNAITSTDNRIGTNVGAYLSSSPVGQFAGKVVGSNSQSARNKIIQARPLLAQNLAKAMGMTGKQLDTNKDMQLMLDAATNPELDVQANKAALDRIELMISDGVSSGPKIGDVKGGYRFKGGSPADKSNWEKL